MPKTKPQLNATAKIVDFALTASKANPSIQCRVDEYWTILASGSAPCGATYTYNTMKRVGVTKTEVDAVTSQVGASLGKKDIAILSGEISKKSSVEISFSILQEETHNYMQPSGRCDRIDVEVLQKKRHLQFDIIKERWVRSPKHTQLHVTEHTNEFYFYCEKTPNHPDCNCQDPPPNILQEILALVGANSCWMRLTLTEAGDGLIFPELGVRIKGDIEPGELYSATLPQHTVPAPVLFLAAEKADQVVFLFAATEDDEHVDWSATPTPLDLEPLEEFGGLSTLDITGLDPGTEIMIVEALESSDGGLSIRDLGDSYEIGSVTISKRTTTD